MPKHDAEHLSAVYEAAERIVERGLRREDSLFTPGRAIWTLAAFEELQQLYVDTFDPGPGTFAEKLKIQIGGGSPDAIQLMAEILYMYYLPESGGVTPATKRDRIVEVLGWLPEPVTVPGDLSAALDRGIGGAGVGFHTYKWASVSWFIRFGVAWKQLPPEHQARILGDPWAFHDFADAIETTGGGTYAKEATLHLVHPDTFERILSRGEKWALAERLSTLVDDPAADVDRRIAQIRGHLAARFGKDFDFYWSIPVAAMWKPNGNRWTSFLYWASRYTTMPDFDATERDYKLALGATLAAARTDAQGGGHEWMRLLDSALRSRNQNLAGWRETDRFLKWLADRPAHGIAALRAVWADGADAVQPVADFLARLPVATVGTPGQRVALASVLRMAVDATQYPPYRPSPLQLAYKLTAFGAPESEEVARYRQALAFFDSVLARAASSDLALRDRLDAQSATWSVTMGGDPPASWPPEDRVAITEYRKGAGEIPPDPPDPPEPPDRQPGRDGSFRSTPEPDGLVPLPSFGALAAKVLIDEEELGDIASLLEAKRQVVFYGPPGTGKTYVARELAWALAGDTSRVKLVQFHPSYAYEDFVEGFRPKLEDGVAGFRLVPGPLRKLAAAAKADPTHRHVLIIDEMNRGNVAKVFGELYFLLEYRDEPIELQYSLEESFAMPANLRFIATMNTADRSIALLDAALRRRFAFIPFFPDREPIAGLLGRWLAQHRPEMAWVAELVDRANAKLGDRNGAIGPSFFMREDLDDARLGLVWEHEIKPYLEDHFFDQPERLAGFAITKLMATPAAAIASAAPVAPAAPVDPAAPVEVVQQPDGDADPTS